MSGSAESNSPARGHSPDEVWAEVKRDLQELHASGVDLIGTVDVTAGAGSMYTTESDDDLYKEIQAMEAELLARRVRKQVPVVDYSRDDYPRDGCTLIIRLNAGQYQWRVYSPGEFREPGYGSGLGDARLLESYCARPMASIGIALCAFAHGRAVRSVLADMARVEHQAAAAQPGDEGSNVT